MTDIDFSRSFGSAAWALARVCCVGFLFLGTTNCLPASPDDTGGTGGGNSSTGGNGGNSSSSSSSHSSQASGGNTSSSSTPSGGGNTYASTSHSSSASGGNTYASTSSSTQSGGGNTYASTSSSTQSGGGNTYASSTSSPPTGGTTTQSSPPPTGGTPSSTPTGTTVTFAAGKAQGAMVGYGWVALGTADTITDPTCGPAKTAISAAASCLTSTNWSSASALCVTGTVPALGTPPDYTGNWGLSVGVNADTALGGLGQSFSSITIAVSGSPSSGLRAMVHKKGDPDATSYCATLTSGAMPLTSFSTTCYTPAAPGTPITAADVPNIDKISVQVSSGTAAIAVSNLCITGITFAK
jgi:hypothetical protein